MEDTTEALYQGATPSERSTHGGDDDPGSGVDRRHLLVFCGASSWMYRLPASGEVIIGRSEEADLRIDTGSVSRQHARLVLDGDVVTISDLGSHNGTYVNKVRVTGRRTLLPNDVIRIHGATLVYHATASGSSSATALEISAFRQRIDNELDRTVRDERMFSVLCFVGLEGGARDEDQRVVLGALRRIDAVAWANNGALYVLLPEAGTEEATAIAARIRGKLERGDLRIGRVTYPADGYVADALIAGAHDAALAAKPGQITGLERPFHTLTVGAQRVIIADPAMSRLYALIERLAPVSLPVLITGETGSGKELVASAIHSLSHRADKPLVSLNCVALHETLVEGELFGHEKGAFLGALAAKPGLIEAAAGSTLFLDEIGELTPAVQARLLRVLESNRVTRVGDAHEREVDVRIVAATNRDLEADVKAGRFRRDLFFRLSAATLHLPPLRQRPLELPLLAAAFLDDACRANGRGSMRISEAAMEVLAAHPWPGNVRELKNLMQYLAATLTVEVLLPEHLMERLGQVRGGELGAAGGTGEGQRFRPIADELRELEVTRIREALEVTGGNQTRAAGLLAMPVRTFFEKAKQYGLTPKKKRLDH